MLSAADSALKNKLFWQKLAYLHLACSASLILCGLQGSVFCSGILASKCQGIFTANLLTFLRLRVPSLRRI